MIDENAKGNSSTRPWRHRETQRARMSAYIAGPAVSMEGQWGYSGPATAQPSLGAGQWGGSDQRVSVRRMGCSLAVCPSGAVLQGAVSEAQPTVCLHCKRQQCF